MPRWMLVILCLVAAVPAASAQPPPGYVQIDGKKTPHAIPQYALWRHTFDTLTKIKDDPEWLRSQLHLPPAEEALLYGTAGAQGQRDAECLERQRPLWESLTAKGVEHDEKMAATLPIRIGCREGDLAAVDTLLAALSPDSRTRLQEWIDGQRRKTTIFVHKSEAGSYKLPR